MSLHAFSPDSACQLSPIEWYEEASLKEGFIHDPAQRNAVAYLQALYEAKTESILGAQLAPT